MVVLRDMIQGEFSQYCDYFIEDYSREIVQNYGQTLDSAIDIAKQDLRKSFPIGVENNDDDLLCIDAYLEKNATMPQLVGYVWISINQEDGTAFICDFYIYDDFRKQGLGKLAMLSLEARLQKAGIHQIKLRVAYHNNRALKLYQDIGFKITGFNMSKTLDVL